MTIERTEVAQQDFDGKTADLEDMTLMEKVAYVKSTMNCWDVIDLCDLDLVGDKIHSPFNEADNTPSCHIYDDHFFDFSTGKGGDVIDLAVALTGRSWGRVINDLAAGATRLDADPDRVKRSVPLPEPDLLGEYRAATYHRGYPKIPGVNSWVVEAATSMTVERDMWIPHWSWNEDNVIRGIKIRHADGRKSAVPGSQFTGQLYSTMYGHSDVAVITEGESDCWALDGITYQGCDVDVYALPCGAGLWRDKWIDQQLWRYDKIYTCMDNDDAGRKATDKIRRAIGWGKWAELRVPTLFKDARAAIIGGWEPKL